MGNKAPTTHGVQVNPLNDSNAARAQKILVMRRYSACPFQFPAKYPRSVTSRGHAMQYFQNAAV